MTTEISSSDYTAQAMPSVTVYPAFSVMLLISLSLVIFLHFFFFLLEVRSKVSCIFVKSVYGPCLLRKDGLLYCFICLIIDHFLTFGRLRNTKKMHNKEHKTHTFPHYPESLLSYISSFYSLIP